MPRSFGEIGNGERDEDRTGVALAGWQLDAGDDPGRLGGHDSD